MGDDLFLLSPLPKGRLRSFDRQICLSCMYFVLAFKTRAFYAGKAFNIIRHVSARNYFGYIDVVFIRRTVIRSCSASNFQIIQCFCVIGFLLVAK